MEENKQVVAEWKALNQPRLQEIKKANPDLYSAVNLALQYLNTKLGGEELPAEIEEEVVVETTPIQAKQWVKEDFFNTKIIVDTPEKSKKFQEFVFGLGLSWANGEKKPMLLDRPYVEIDSIGKLSYAKLKHTWDGYFSNEIFYDDIFPPQTETKQWTLGDFEDIKIIVDTPEKSRKFQELFLSLGGKWSILDNPNQSNPANFDKPYLAINRNTLLFFNNLKPFEEQSFKQIFYDDIFPGESQTTTVAEKAGQWRMKTKEEFDAEGIVSYEDFANVAPQFVYDNYAGKYLVDIYSTDRIDSLKEAENRIGNTSLHLNQGYTMSSSKFWTQKPLPQTTTSAQQKKYGLPIETYPTFFSFPIPGFSANTGDRQSPTQSAGELRRWFSNLGNVAQIEYARELDRARFKGNDGNWYALNTGRGGVFTWKKTTPPPTQYTPSAASSSPSASTSFSSTSSAQPAQPVAKPAINYKPEDLIGRNIYYKGNYKIVKILKVNPKTVRYQISNSLKDIELDIPKTAIGSLLEGKVVGKSFLKDSTPVQTPVQSQNQSTISNSFEDSLTSLSDSELKQLYDDTEAAKAEFDAADPEYKELRLQLVAIANEMDNRNL